MTDQPAQSSITGLEKLLVDPKYSDLVLKCEGQTFAVHRCIICSKSPIFAAACDGGFQEANSKVIDVTIADVPTLQRLLTFLYTCDYDDGSGSSLAIEQAKSESVVDPEKDKSRMPANERWVLSPPLDSSSDSTQPWSCGSDGGTDHAHEETLDKMNMNQALMANAQVYVAADYYQIPELMRLAVDKFRKRSMKFYQPGFADVVAFVFQCTPNLAPEMKNILGSTFLKNAVSLVSDTTFMDTGDRLSGFFKRALPLVVAAMSAH